MSQKPADFASRVGFWVRRRVLAEEITAKRTNNAYTGNMRIPENVDASDDLASVVKGADIVVLAVPHEFLDARLQIRPEFRNWTPRFPETGRLRLPSVAAKTKGAWSHLTPT